MFGIFSCARWLFVNREKNVYLDSLHILKLSSLSSIAELYTFENIFWLLSYQIDGFQIFSLILCVFLLS